MKINCLKLCSLVVISNLLLSCQPNRGNKAAQNQTTDSTITKPADTLQANSPAAQTANSGYAKETTNGKTAEMLKNFLLKKLSNDLKLLAPSDREFSFYEIDLNNDQKPEYFISLQGRYFCGTGGCSYYLLNNDLSVNTYFSVTNPPIYRSSALSNGWHNLILQGKRNANGGVETFIHLKYDKQKGKYPSNPSLVEQSNIAPSGHDYIMWDENFAKAKIFQF